MNSHKTLLTLGDLGEYLASLATVMYQPKPVIPTDAKFKHCLAQAFQKHLSELLKHFKFAQVVITADPSKESPLIEEMFATMKRKRLAVEQADGLHIRMTIEDAHQHLASLKGPPAAGALFTQILMDAMSAYKE